MPAPRLVLGSKSPRRAALLSDAGYAFRQVDPPFDDPADPSIDADPGVDPEMRATQLATRKAMSLSPLLEEGEIGLTADTLCVDAAGRLIGTPTTRDEASAMIAAFVGASHRVITGVAMARQGVVIEPFADTATVTLGRLSRHDIADYVATDQWHGKAGGYNLTDRLAAGWPLTVQGDPDTVVGLPSAKLKPRFNALEVFPA